MKKIMLMLAFLPTTLIFAQEQNENKNIENYTLSANTVISTPSQFGLSLEINLKEQKATDTYRSSAVLNLSAGSMKLETTNGKDITATGFVIDLGSRSYFKNKKENPFQGLYMENLISYGNIKFDKQVGLTSLEGTYSYFSLFNPAIGYKLNLGRFSIDPSIGFNWKWEFKGKGDMDNKIVDNFVLRYGAKIGYRF